MLLELGEGEEEAGKIAQDEICLFPDIFYKSNHTVNVFFGDFFFPPLSTMFSSFAHSLVGINTSFLFLFTAP